MWSSKPEPAAPTPDPEPVPSDPPSTLPIAFQSKEARRKRWPPPSREQLRAPRLLSLGRQTRQVQGSYRGSQKPRIVEVEAYLDMNNPNNTYVREPGSHVIQPTTIRSGGETQIIDQFFVPTSQRNPPSGNHPAGRPNEIIPPPPISDEERRLARALFAKPTAPSDPKPVPAFDDCPW